jgi:hypothetical protein
MTLFSKILVVTLFGLSVVVMTWAMMFYIHREDLSEKTGKLKPRKEHVAELWEGVRAADASYRGNRADVLAQERYRIADRPWYDAELKHALSGATAANPVREPVFNNGVLVVAAVDAQNPKHVRPQLVPAKDAFGRPLESLVANLAAEQKKVADLVARQVELVTLIKQDTELTEQLVPPVGKGLRQRIEDEKVKIKLMDEELAIIRPLLVNTTVESELILRRREMLEARIKELTAAADVAAGPKQP